MTFAFPSPFVILLVEDDEGHAALIREALEDAGYRDPLRHFRDGQEVLNFLMSPQALSRERRISSCWISAFLGSMGWRSCGASRSVRSFTIFL